MRQSPLRLDLIYAERQTDWKWPAAANFILSGAGAGLYLLSASLIQVTRTTTGREPSVFGEIAALILVTTGFLCVSIELGHLASAKNSVRRLTSSWISREVVFGIVFLVAALLHLSAGYAFFRVAAALAAAGILVSQGFILKGARSVAIWNLKMTPALIVVSGLQAGYGLSLLVHFDPGLRSGIYLAAGMLVNSIDLILWVMYVRSATAELELAFRPLRSKKFEFFSLGVGHIAPILLIAFCALLSYHRLGDGLCRPILFFSGISMLVGSALQKAALVLRAGFKTGMWLETG